MKASWLFPELNSIKLAEIFVAKNAQGELQLPDKSIIPYIAAKTNMPPDDIADMVKIDMRAFESTASFRFADEVSLMKEIQLGSYPRQFCLTCFTNALLKSEIPVFDPYWHFVWSTHCTVDGSPLFPANLLDGQRYNIYGFQRDDGSQYDNWVSRIEAFRVSLLGRGISIPEVRANTSSSLVLSVNKLFNNPRQAKQGAEELGFSRSPEWVRQKFYSIFFLLSRKLVRFSLGTHLTRLMDEKPAFPHSNYFSGRIIDELAPNKVDRCLEFTAQFLLNSKTIRPYLLDTYVKQARSDLAVRTNESFSDLAMDPMSYLALEVIENFDRTFENLLAKLFPLYAEEWAEVCTQMREYLKRHK